MGTGYTRNDTANNIADGNVINAADFDGEYDAIEAAFNSSTGHTHDGTSAEGAPITVLGPSQEFVATSSEVKPSTNAGLDLGTASLKFKDLYIDGTAYIDGLGGNLLVDTTNALQFRDAQLAINSSADGQLDIAADTTAKITSPEVIVTDDFRLQSDAAILTFGADDDVSVTHVADTGLDAKAASGFTLKLQTGDTTIESGNTLGKISFNAPDEASGTDAILVGAEIEAAAEATFDSATNSTALVFKTNTSGAATERMRVKSDGDIVFNGASYDMTWDTSANALTFADNGKAIFGAGSDLQIYHDGSDSFITDTGAGNLQIWGGNFRLRSSDGSEAVIDGNSGGAVTLYYDNAAKLATTDTGVDITGTLTSDGLTVDGTATITTTGNETQLTLTSTDADATTGPNMAFFRNSSSAADGDQTGSVFFIGKDDAGNDTTYGSLTSHIVDASNTTEDGRVTLSSMKAGTLTDTLHVVSGSVGIGTSSPGGKLAIFDSTSATFRLETPGVVAIAHTFDGTDYTISNNDGSVGHDIIFGSKTAGAESMRIDSSGNVGIGTTSPDRSLHIAGNPGMIILEDTGGATDDKRAAIFADTGLFEIASKNDDDSTRLNDIFVADLGTGDIRMGDQGGTSTSRQKSFTISHQTGASSEYGGIKFLRAHQNSEKIGASIIHERPASSLDDSDLLFKTSTSNTNAVERARVTHDGNFLVGSTSTSGMLGGSSNNGSYLSVDGGLFAARSGDAVAHLNRNDSDGEIIELRKDGTIVGSIGIQSSGFYIDGESGHAGVRFANDAIVPRDAGADTNGTTNIGAINNKWQDLYLSGGVYLGGTGSANKLDDYEEGLWTPQVGGSNCTGSATYIKIGEFVHINIDITAAGGISATNQITNLPFTVKTGYHSAFAVGYTNSGIEGGYFDAGSAVMKCIVAGSTSPDNINAGERLIIFGTYRTT